MVSFLRRRCGFRFDDLGEYLAPGTIIVAPLFWFARGADFSPAAVDPDDGGLLGLLWLEACEKQKRVSGS